jgi:DNA polymerase III alpha subunit
MQGCWDEHDNEEEDYSYWTVGLIINRNNLDEYGLVYHGPDTNVLLGFNADIYRDTGGLVRFEFIGLKILDDIKRCETAIREQGAELSGFSFNDIPLDDKATFNLLSEGNTDGVFLLENTRMQKALQQLKPDCIEHLIALSAAVFHRCRGIIELPWEFTQRRHGRKPIEYPLPCLEDILKETYGLIFYKEQFMLIAQRVAGYTLGQADRYLKEAQNTDEEMKRFITAAAAQGFSEQDVKRIFERYHYPKSQAVSYAILAYRIAYLKAHYPAEFISANFTYESNSQKDKHMSFFRWNSKYDPFHIMSADFTKEINSQKDKYVNFYRWFAKYEAFRWRAGLLLEGKIQGIISNIRLFTSSKGDSMAFAALKAEDDEIELYFSPSVWDKCQDKIETNKIASLKGSIQYYDIVGNYNFIVDLNMVADEAENSNSE